MQARPGLLGSANVTQAAQAAVAAASSELGAALAGAKTTLERTQREDPEVRKKKICHTWVGGCLHAQELHRKVAQYDQSTDSPATKW